MKVAKDVTAKYPQVEFYAVSCKAHRDVCSQYAIRGYPTVHAFPAASETSKVLGTQGSEGAIVKALRLDEKVEEEVVAVVEDRKLVNEEDGETGDEGENGDEDDEGEDDTEDDGDVEEEADEDDESDAGADTGHAKLRNAGRLSNKASANEDDLASSDENDENDNDATESEGNDEDGDSEEEDVPVDTDGVEDESDEENDSAATGEVDEDSDELEMDLDINKMAPGDTDEDDESGDTEDDGDAEEFNATDENDEDESDDEEDDTDVEVEEEETESDEDIVLDNARERWEEDSSEDLDRIGDAPRSGMPIEEYRNGNKNGVLPGAGALKGKSQVRDMDKWKELIAKKKQEFEKRRRGRRGRKNKANQPGGEAKEGATKVMKANTPGTNEFQTRMQKLMIKINRLRKKRGLPPLTGSAATLVTKKSEMPLKKEVKKPGFARRQGEKLPIVKRIFKMTEEEELILDASLSFMAGLKYGVFKSDDILTAKQTAALKGWLDLMSVSLPPEWGLHSLIDELNDNIDFVSQSNENLLKILRKHPLPRTTWSPSCMRLNSSQGFSCGMWKLLHTSTVGIAEQRGGLNLIESGAVDRGTRVFSPADAADTIREYMAFFFGCIPCRDHFIAQYDECSFRRCVRLTDDELLATPEDWKQLALWLWEVHNHVSIKVAHERIEREMENAKTTRHRMAVLKREDEIKHLYPSLEQCFQCFDENGSFDEANVFEFLEATYWSGPDVTFDKLLQYRGEEGSGLGYFWVFVIVALAVAYLMRGRKVEGLQRTMNVAMVKGRQIGGTKKRSA